MTLEIIPDMPELIEEAREWRPKTYPEHFRDSSLADKELAMASANIHGSEHALDQSGIDALLNR